MNVQIKTASFLDTTGIRLFEELDDLWDLQGMLDDQKQGQDPVGDSIQEKYL